MDEGEIIIQKKKQLISFVTDLSEDKKELFSLFIVRRR